MLQTLSGQVLDPKEAEPDWQRCRDHLLPFFEPAKGDTGNEAPVLWRLSLPQTAPALDLPYPQLIEWHGALRWLWAPWSAHDLIHAHCRRQGGSASVFRDPQGTNTAERFTPLDPVLHEVHQRLQAQFDPEGIFNPGRMYPSLRAGERHAN